MSRFQTCRCDGPKCGREVQGYGTPANWRSFPEAKTHSLPAIDVCSRRCLVEFIDKWFEMPDFAAMPEPER